MKNDNRIYHVAVFPRLSPVSFCGKNAKRDAQALAKRNGGRVRRMTGAEWDRMAESRSR